ncbi:hypothetical protein BKA62DRAFT_631322 [Auriculariales sp. MPI-PUGE-AT-0066]|nr:hypothetical protein BKA62DRAFT_631322 [Auriculariales sp. MPI-PUGE-AT-0066]
MSGGQAKSGKRGDRAERDRIYGHPLPVVLAPSLSRHILGIRIFRSSGRIEQPRADGVFDQTTISVCVFRPDHIRLLWERGFFGKGSLSRSEPTWLTRMTSAAGPGGPRAAEVVTAKRRQQRKQFKADRARAMTEATKDAETAFSEGRGDNLPAPNEVSRVLNSQAREFSAESLPAESSETIPQIETIEDLEFLQLTLEEAFFLAWSLDVLRVTDSSTQTVMSLPRLWQTAQAAHSLLGLDATPRADNPFLIRYAVYHHFRSLGWVVRSGIKFCTDYLLYNRGPVFTHAEFAVIVCPVYENEEDRLSSPFFLDNATPMQWAALSTIGRVNAQVHKTVILAYVTIPSLHNDAADLLLSPRCLERYSVREVVLRRWVPARLRD